MISSCCVFLFFSVVWGDPNLPVIVPVIITPTFVFVRSSNNSTLYQSVIDSVEYADPPYVIDLWGTRQQIGFDYAALLHSETSESMTSFLNSVFPDASDQALILKFTDYCWDSFLSQFTPTSFLQELDGMKSFYSSPAGQQVDPAEVPAYIVSTRFYTLANMPADAVNIVSMLEEELEADWPEWLKLTINEIIRLLEKLVHSCDAFGVWGPRTVGGYCSHLAILTTIRTLV